MCIVAARAFIVAVAGAVVGSDSCERKRVGWVGGGLLRRSV